MDVLWRALLGCFIVNDFKDAERWPSGRQICLEHF